MQYLYSPDPDPSKNTLPVINVPLQSPYLEEGDDEISLGEIFALIRRRWWILLLVAIATGGAFLKSQLDKPPVYRADFQLLVAPPKALDPDPLLENLQGLSLLQGSGNNQDYFATQLEILKSNTLLEPVWQQITREEQNRGNDGWISYSNFSENALLVERLESTSIVEVTFEDSDQERVKRVLDALAQAYLDYTANEQARIEKSKLGFVSEQLPKFRDATEKLRQQLIDLQKQYKFFSPNLTGEILSRELLTLSTQKKELLTKIEQLQAKKQFLVSQTGITDTTEAFNVSSLAQSPTYAALLAQLTTVKTQLAQATSIYTNDSPQVQALEEEQENLLALINAEVKRQPLQSGDAANLLTAPDVAGPRAAALQDLAATETELELLTIQLTELNQRENQRQAELRDFTSVAGQYATLSQELSLQQKALDQFLEAKQSLEIEFFNSFTPWRVVTQIQAPNQPISTLPRDILLALVLGVVAGAGVAALVDKLDPTYHNLDQLQSDSRQTLLGTIPFEAKLRSCLKNNQTLKSTSLFEAFSKLYSNLFFLNRKQSCRAFVLTSAESRDGKSTTSFFLAQAAAKLGQKVLLIDGDRYFPQEENWKQLAAITNSNSHLLELELPASDSLGETQPEPMADNLFYYKVPDNMMNPEQLVSASQKFDRQMKLWREAFDLILIDTPPLLGLTDSRLIADQTDGVVLVVRLGKTRKESIKGALEELGLADLNILGIVANSATAKSGGYGYYSNYYNRYYRKYAASQAEQAQQNNGQTLLG
jgi:capsular exopolysaccharide synthesis family protein